MPEVSLLPAAGDQALWARRQVITLFAPMPVKAVRGQAANLNSPMTRKTSLVKKTLRQTRMGSRLQVTARWHQMAKRGRNTLKLKTLSPALARSLVDTRTQTQSPTLGRKSSPSSKSCTQKAPRRTAPLRRPANHLLRKSHQQTRHSATRPGKKLGCWTRFNAWHRKKIAKGITGWATRDTMICDLPEHGKTQPNHPDPWGHP